MKGLLIKDIKLLVKQQRFFSSIIFIAVVLTVVTDNPSFIVGYMTFIGSFFTLSSITYDEFDNGNAFLFSLPITRRMYTKEKYSFALILGGGFWVFSTALAAAVGEMKQMASIGDTLIISCIILPIMLVMLSIMLPFQLKYGGEKGRIAAIVMVGGIFIAFLIMAKAAEWLNIDLEGVFSSFPTMDGRAIVAAALIFTVVILLISIRASIFIMEKKEF